MSKTLLVLGFGPGISDAVARRFGSAGYRVGIVARSADKLEASAASLRSAGVDAHAFPADLADPASVAGLVARVEAALGPIAVLHYNAYSSGAGDLLGAPALDLRGPLDVAVTSLVAAVQAAHPSLKAQAGAVLVTGGGFAFYDAQIDAMATQFHSAGLAVAKAAQHKTVGLLAQRLAADGIFVGEVTVLGLVKGTAFDSGHASLEPAAIAAKFWEIHAARAPLYSSIG